MCAIPIQDGARRIRLTAAIGPAVAIDLGISVSYETQAGVILVPFKVCIRCIARNKFIKPDASQQFFVLRRGRSRQGE
ncbi:hypothetical protein AW736_09990 [Termitidicoccus mucosus]|uniref:Uncharacterized protein n=1 Tax=Termitidicoccus mucosus TaxID=1184151 RepID=A0A178IK12_9BACT|nr:hypothetical protein AW736_09990 [Opitutaceae bacterium TSB47]